ncbi:MAG TPA: hypothetical protein VIM98_00200 [Dyella sp.]|uniref:hypothetical protein n=1 Tax=Dyella sp. TaxID=1869338 RepID=UPI002F940083
MSEADRFGGKGGDGRRLNLTPPDEQQVPRRSETQESPHHGFDDRDGKALPADPHMIDDEPRVGGSYQSGGRGLDREVLDVERKNKESGGSWKSPRAPRGARDPAPGAPINRRR